MKVALIKSYADYGKNCGIAKQIEGQMLYNVQEKGLNFVGEDDKGEKWLFSDFAIEELRWKVVCGS